jgi:hypothetical protein
VWADKHEIQSLLKTDTYEYMKLPLRVRFRRLSKNKKDIVIVCIEEEEKGNREDEVKRKRKWGRISFEEKEVGSLQKCDITVAMAKNPASSTRHRKIIEKSCLFG